jgi:hypothetical protein
MGAHSLGRTDGLTVHNAWQAINQALWALGVVTKRDDEELRSKMAYGMFDTRGRCIAVTAGWRARVMCSMSHESVER